MKPGCLVFETGEIFKGFLFGETAQAGEAVFNTSHAGYEEIAADPSYHNQILIMTAPMQGNYGSSASCRQSDRFWIKGFVCLEPQNSERDRGWLDALSSRSIPLLSFVDTRQIVLRLREKGTVWAGLVPLSKDSFQQAMSLIKEAKSQPKDWTKAVSLSSAKEIKGRKRKGPKLALVDFGFKKNILTEMLIRAERVCVFPSTASEKDIRSWNPDGIVLSNGPGDPKDVADGLKLVKNLLSWNKPLFGICMGHQVLAIALGAKTYKLKFGHRGGNHPIEDKLLGQIYISSQNHGYAVQADSLPKDVQVSHINLNDKTVAGIFSARKNCMGVQFHPENGPGPKEALALFDFFMNKLIKSAGPKAFRAAGAKKGQNAFKKRH